MTIADKVHLDVHERVKLNLCRWWSAWIAADNLLLIYVNGIYVKSSTNLWYLTLENLRIKYVEFELQAEWFNKLAE